jgi:GNAT superfamily N-acetyltransferase
LEGVVVAEARPEEVEMVLEILNEAADWLQAKGIDQWQTRYFTRSLILEQTGRGEVYLARLDGNVVGTITLQWSDPLWWEDAPPDAGYFHRLAIKREYAAKGLGRALVRWAESRARASGKKYLRLNCMFENPRIRRYYEDLGFVYRGDAFLRGGSVHCALYEKRV